MAQTTTKVHPEMTGQEMREYYLHQTLRSLADWEGDNFPVRENPPFALESERASEYLITPEWARQIGLRAQVEAFAEEAKVSTAGVRENQNVICSWDHRYRINEYIVALMAEALARLAKELQAERRQQLQPLPVDRVRRKLGEEVCQIIEEIFERPLEQVVEAVMATPFRIVGGEVRANTPRYVTLMSRIYAAHGLPVLLTEAPDGSDTSNIYMWSFLTFLLGLSGGDYFTSSHGAPQKQSDKILAPDGAQYLPDLYARIVGHLFGILEQIESDGFTIRLSGGDDPKLMRTLSYSRVARLYAAYLRTGPAGPKALATMSEAVAQGLRLKMDFFGGSGYKTLHAVLEELGIAQVFEGGYLRAEEDSFFHNVGFRVALKKDGSGYEVVHDGVDASVPAVVRSAGYHTLLKDDSCGQIVFNVDPDADRFVAGQVVAGSELDNLDRLGVEHLPIGENRHFAIYSPNQFFLMLAEADRAMAVEEGTWSTVANFNIHSYVSACAWDEWAAFYDVPVVRVPVGFKEIAAVCRQVEAAYDQDPEGSVEVSDALGQTLTLGRRPKLHHAGEESGGKIGGPREPLFNVLGQKMLAVREKSGGEAVISAVVLASRLFLRADGKPEQLYLHDYLEEIFEQCRIRDRMEYRGDIIHYNEAIFDPVQLARAKKAGIAERMAFNGYFRRLATGLKEGRISLEQAKTLLQEALPGMAREWRNLERIDLWPDGLQFWFEGSGKVRDICIRPSGTDAKTKIYFDGTDKPYLISLFADHLRDFQPRPSARFEELLGG